ncbi:sugar ABC transporter substrate-binding protein [soil metagenome]
MRIIKGSSGSRWLALVGAVAILALAAPVSAQDESPGSGNPYFEQGTEPGSGEGLRIGYISLGEAIPFVKLVSDSIREQADVAGAELIFCDAQIADAEALACAQQMAVADVQGVINFQLNEQISPEICAAYGDVPTVAIDIHQEPCEVAFFGADNRFAGFVAGEAVGQHLAAGMDCMYDQVITLESVAAGIVNEDRTLGSIEGFESICGEVPDDKIQRIDVGGTTDLALTSVGNLLPTIPAGGRLIVLSLNDDMALGALAAARTAGRESELVIGAQGADPSSWPEIACNPQWIADAAYFPERYGRTAVPAMIDILAGESVPELLFTPHVPVTAENIFELYPEAPACG